MENKNLRILILMLGIPFALIMGFGLGLIAADPIVKARSLIGKPGWERHIEGVWNATCVSAMDICSSVQQWTFGSELHEGRELNILKIREFDSSGNLSSEISSGVWSIEMAGDHEALFNLLSSSPVDSYSLMNLDQVLFQYQGRNKMKLRFMLPKSTYGENEIYYEFRRVQ